MNQEIKDFLNKNDHFARHNQMKLLEVDTEYAVAEMKIDQKHLNGAGIVQGGALFTLADLAFAAAANSNGPLWIGLQNHISFFKPVYQGVVRAVAKGVHKGKKTGYYEVEIWNEAKELIAKATGTAYRKADQM